MSHSYKQRRPFKRHRSKTTVTTYDTLNHQLKSSTNPHRRPTTSSNKRTPSQSEFPSRTPAKRRKKGTNTADYSMSLQNEDELDRKPGNASPPLDRKPGKASSPLDRKPEKASSPLDYSQDELLGTLKALPAELRIQVYNNIPDLESVRVSILFAYFYYPYFMIPTNLLQVNSRLRAEAQDATECEDSHRAPALIAVAEPPSEPVRNDLRLLLEALDKARAIDAEWCQKEGTNTCSRGFNPQAIYEACEHLKRNGILMLHRRDVQVFNRFFRQTVLRSRRKQALQLRIMVHRDLPTHFLIAYQRMLREVVGGSTGSKWADVVMTIVTERGTGFARMKELQTKLAQWDDLKWDVATDEEVAIIRELAH